MAYLKNILKNVHMMDLLANFVLRIWLLSAMSKPNEYVLMDYTWLKENVDFLASSVQKDSDTSCGVLKNGKASIHGKCAIIIRTLTRG